MKAMVLEMPRQALKLRELPITKPGEGQILIKIYSCGICRTDLHVIDGELPHPKLPLVPGHEISGMVEATGKKVKGFKSGDRVGVPWLAFTCGKCKYCKAGKENLCDSALFTGYTVDGGYSEYTVANEKFCFLIPDQYSFAEASPLLCAGLIGYRSYSAIDKSAVRIGIYGFGAAAHILTQVAKHEGKEIYAFTKSGDNECQNFAKELGAVWAGSASDPVPGKLDAAIIFAPAGELVPVALRATDKGGTVVCGGIHMSDIPSFPYQILWGERGVKSIANLTRKDGDEFMKVISSFHIKAEITKFPLENANEAIQLLREGKIKGAAVLEICKE